MINPANVQNVAIPQVGQGVYYQGVTMGFWCHISMVDTDAGIVVFSHYGKNDAETEFSVKIDNLRVSTDRTGEQDAVWPWLVMMFDMIPIKK